ncbi:MAG: Replication initiator protein A [Rhodocyclaceae bacterium]|nr:Replication initiator protein A [Rhodocyclaceae bacterium]
MENHDGQVPFQFEERKEPTAPAWIANVAARAKQRREQETIAAGLPEWPEKARGIPNGALRSSLFGAIRRAPRKFLKRTKLQSVNGLTIVFNGPRLSQSDLDVWEHCLHLARINGTGCQIRFTGYSFLKAIGRNTGKSDREWLKGVLLDLASSVVEISDGKRAYFGPLIHHGVRDEVTMEFVIEVNPRVAILYGADGWTQIEWAQRWALRRQPLAQWLHGFYSTHAEPYPYKVETLRRLAGSENEHLYSFRQELRSAMSKVSEVTGWAWCIADADLVKVTKLNTHKSAGSGVRKVGG